MDQKEQLFKNDCIKGLVSSLVVTFNSEKYIYEAIDSVLMQDYPKIELIISDDGSKVFDEKIIRGYIESKKTNNLVNLVIIHHENNVGTVRNINNALANARGEYIKILAGDDTYPESRIFTNQIAMIQKNHALAVIGKTQQCNEKMMAIRDERVEKSNKELPIVLKMKYGDARKYISKKDIFPIAIQAVCYHREFFLRNGFCDENYLLIDDAPSALMILKEAENVLYMDEFTVNHRAKVGISSSRELFAARRLLYYKDCVTYAKLEIDSHPELYSFLYRKENIRINEFVYRFAKIKADNGVVSAKVKLCLSYIDAIIYYVLTNPKKVLLRIRERFQK